MRYFILLWAIVIVAVSIHAGASKTEGGALFVEGSSGASINVMELQMQADQNLPVTLIDNLV